MALDRRKSNNAGLYKPSREAVYLGCDHVPLPCTHRKKMAAGAKCVKLKRLFYSARIHRTLILEPSGAEWLGSRPGSFSPENQSLVRIRYQSGLVLKRSALGEEGKSPCHLSAVPNGYFIIVIICKGWGCWPVPSSNMEHLWGLWVIVFFFLSRLPAYCNWTKVLLRVSFPQTCCLPWLTSPVYPPRNPGQGPSPGATHGASGTWSSHKAGSPLPVVALSPVRVPIFCF
jgi:hypothetical protein